MSQRSNEASIESAEIQLGLTIPDEIDREFFSSKLNENFITLGIPVSPADLLSVNLACRHYHSLEYWKPSWLAITDDHSGNHYFIDTYQYDGKVYYFDHEKTFPGYNPMASPAFASIKAFIEAQMELMKDDIGPG